VSLTEGSAVGEGSISLTGSGTGGAAKSISGLGSRTGVVIFTSGLISEIGTVGVIDGSEIVWPGLYTIPCEISWSGIPDPTIKQARI